MLSYQYFTEIVTHLPLLKTFSKSLCFPMNLLPIISIQDFKNVFSLQYERPVAKSCFIGILGNFRTACLVIPLFFPSSPISHLHKIKHTPHYILYTSHSTSFSSVWLLKNSYELLPLVLPVKKMSLEEAGSKHSGSNFPDAETCLFPAEIELGFCSNSRSIKHEYLSACSWQHYERQTTGSYHLLQPSKYGRRGKRQIQPCCQ